MHSILHALLESVLVRILDFPTDSRIEVLVLEENAMGGVGAFVS